MFLNEENLATRTLYKCHLYFESLTYLIRVEPHSLLYSHSFWILTSVLGVGGRREYTRNQTHSFKHTKQEFYLWATPPVPAPHFLNNTYHNFLCTLLQLHKYIHYYSHYCTSLGRKMERMPKACTEKGRKEGGREKDRHSGKQRQRDKDRKQRQSQTWRAWTPTLRGKIVVVLSLMLSTQKKFKQYLPNWIAKTFGY